MLFQHYNYGFSVPVLFRSKAQCEAQGPFPCRALQRGCGTATGMPRVSLSTPTDCVAPLNKGVAIVCEARLAVNVDKLTELAIIMLKEH